MSFLKLHIMLYTKTKLWLYFLKAFLHLAKYFTRYKKVTYTTSSNNVAEWVGLKDSRLCHLSCTLRAAKKSRAYAYFRCIQQSFLAESWKPTVAWQYTVFFTIYHPKISPAKVEFAFRINCSRQKFLPCTPWETASAFIQVWNSCKLFTMNCKVSF